MDSNGDRICLGGAEGSADPGDRREFRRGDRDREVGRLERQVEELRRLNDHLKRNAAGVRARLRGARIEAQEQRRRAKGLEDRLGRCLKSREAPGEAYERLAREARGVLRVVEAESKAFLGGAAHDPPDLETHQNLGVTTDGWVAFVGTLLGEIARVREIARLREASRTAMASAPRNNSCGTVTLGAVTLGAGEWGGVDPVVWDGGDATRDPVRAYFRKAEAAYSEWLRATDRNRHARFAVAMRELEEPGMISDNWNWLLTHMARHLGDLRILLDQAREGREAFRVRLDAAESAVEESRAREAQLEEAVDRLRGFVSDFKDKADGFLGTDPEEEPGDEDEDE